VPAAQLRDGPLLAGLLIAALSAAGLSAPGAPVAHRTADDGVELLLLLDGCHVTVHAYPERALLLLDVLAPAAHDARKALDVFTRRLTAREVRSDLRERG
jgi:S-adenosylmethionine/arginine decarboxylase-like enzyme